MAIKKSIILHHREYLQKKIIINCIVLLSLLFTAGCNKTGLLSPTDDDETIDYFEEYGIRHNKLLEQYFSSPIQIHITFEQQVKSIDSLHAAMDADIRTGLLARFMEDKPEQTNILKRISTNDFDHIMALGMLVEFENTNQITSSMYQYLLPALSLYNNDYDDYREFQADLVNLSEEIAHDQLLETEERDRLLKIMTIAQYSIQYLLEQTQISDGVDSKITGWARRSLMGAVVGITSDIDDWSLVIGGPKGSFGVMVGWAAVSSAYR